MRDGTAQTDRNAQFEHIARRSNNAPGQCGLKNGLKPRWINHFTLFKE